jgi:hypothetical protein
LLISGFLDGHATFSPVLTFTGLDSGHAYNLYIASLHNTEVQPTDFLVGSTSNHLAYAGATDWANHDNYALLSTLVPRTNGQMTVKAKSSATIYVNGFQLED